jgi:hypothetical protein
MKFDLHQGNQIHESFLSAFVATILRQNSGGHSSWLQQVNF